MDDRNENMGVTILHFLERKLQGPELRRFFDWLNSSEKNRQDFTELKSIYDEREMPVDLSDGWSRLSLKLNRHNAARQRARRWRWVTGIAFLCLALIAGLLLLHREQTEATAVTYVTNNTPSNIGLPDGTTVRLAPNSRLTYLSDFGEQTRDVELEGEAYFVVKKDAKRTFSVKAQHQTIIVTGTQFNVCCYPDEEFTTTLKEGSIRFKSMALKKEIDLQPGEQIRYNPHDGSITVCQASMETELAWLDNKHVFKDAQLDRILSKMGHVYNCTFTCDDQQINQMRYTGTFHDTDSLPVFLSVIETLTGLKATANEQGTEVHLHK